MDTYRAVWTREDRSRPSTNSQTMALPDIAALAPFFFKERFARHYSNIRDLFQACTKPGLLAVAIDHAGFAGASFLEACPDRITTSVIGRHAKADLFLDDDPALSLRHLMVIIHPNHPPDDLRFRLIDLRTSVAFSDEQGRRLEALEAESPVFVSCGRYGIYFFPTDGSPWPEDAEDGWACIPERVFLDDLAAGRRGQRPQAPPRRNPAHTMWRAGGLRPSIALPGPAFAHHRMVDEDEDPLGELRIECERGKAAILLGSKAARRGMLLGRYPRCDNSSLHVLSSDHVSRVHLLVIELCGTLYAIDAASSFGVLHNGAPARTVPLRYGTELALSNAAVARVRWCPVN